MAFYAENGQSSDADPMAVDVYSLANVKLAELAFYHVYQLPNTWGQKTLSMTPYIGQTVIVRFTRSNSTISGGGGKNR